MKLMRGLSARLVAAAAAKMSLLAEAPKTTRLSQTQRRRQPGADLQDRLKRGRLQRPTGRANV